MVALRVVDDPHPCGPDVEPAKIGQENGIGELDVPHGEQHGLHGSHGCHNVHPKKRDLRQ
jgi:hypothetical protein